MKHTLRLSLRGHGPIRSGLGFRTIKTAIAVMLCFLVYEGFHLLRNQAFVNYLEIMPFYACAAAIICMQDTLQNTLRQGIARVIGTFLGGAVGLLALLIMPYSHPLVVVLIMGLCIVLCISLCNLIGHQSACAIGCVVFLAVTASRSQSAPYIYALYRMGETTLGIAIAVLVNRFFNKPKWLTRLSHRLAIRLKHPRRTAPAATSDTPSCDPAPADDVAPTDLLP